MRRLPRACRRRVSTASSSRPTATSWTASGRPPTNHRDDDFGGSLDNRLRFTFRVIDAVSAAVGSEFIVGIRMVADEDFSAGLSRTEGVEIARVSPLPESSTSSTSFVARSRPMRR